MLSRHWLATTTVPVVQLRPLAIGIVPPARNFADSPDIAVTVGSARMRATPWRSKASNCPWKVLPPLLQFNRALVAEISPLIAKGLVTWNELPEAFWPNRLTPSCLTMSRRISETVTRKATWSAPRMVSELMSLPELTCGGDDTVVEVPLVVVVP